MVSIGSMMGSAQPVMLAFPLERPVFLREYATGTYSVLAYFMSKVKSLNKRTHDSTRWWRAFNPGPDLGCEDPTPLVRETPSMDIPTLTRF